MIAALLLVACTPEPSAETGDTAVPSDTAAPDACSEGPVVTYDNFGAGFLTQHCTSCHAATAPDRHEAPADVVFDTEEEALAWADRILARAASDPTTMPPQGGTSEDDRALLALWLGCGD